jgi:PTS system mannose-specific IIB component
MIALFRVDDRVIHGQTITKLISEYPCNGIIIVDDEIVTNSIMSQIYKNVVPSDIKVHIFSIEKALAKLSEAEISPKNYFVIFKSVLAIDALVKAGYTLKQKVNVGPASVRAGSVTIIPGLSLLKEEIQAYNYLVDKGIEVEMQPIFTQKKVYWESIRQNYKV